MTASFLASGKDLRSGTGIARKLGLWVAVVVVVALSSSAWAQTGGQAGITGTVTDGTGAAIPNATVTATESTTAQVTTRQTDGSGLFTMSPIPPGIYTVRVKVAGFSEYVQQNFQIDALRLTPLNVKLKVGGADTTVEVTEAPPQLETTNATLGLTIESAAYANLPLQVNGQMRDPTAFGNLAPGAQGGARLPIIGGIGNYLGQLYLDGLPAETVSQQGDNRLVAGTVNVDAVDQMQVVTSTPPAEYSGAGSENFTMKSGGLKYHGQVSDFIHNTALDAWGFLAKEQTAINSAGVSGPAPKAVDHQNEFSASVGGHVPGTKRVFFFGAYDRYHQRKVNLPASYTIPSTLERTGDFTELSTSCTGSCIGVGLTGTGANNPAFLFDPTNNNCGAALTRCPLQAMKGGVLTNNVIPANYISPQAQFLQKFLPAPTNPLSLTSNYTSGYPGGFDNWAADWRVDFDWTPKHRISTVGAMGTINYLNNYAAPWLPPPYIGGDLANIYPKVFDVEDVYTLNNSMVNQIKFGFVRFYQNIHNGTQGTQYAIGNAGVTNLPQGQAGQEFPGFSFGTSGKFGTAQQTWTGNGNSVATQLTTPNNYTILDNFQWTKGRHSITAGISIQLQEINNANPATFTGILSLSANANDTAPFNGTGLDTSAASTGGGYSYASFLLGAIGGTPSLGLQPVAEVGGRYLAIAPYVEDTWKVNSKLTIDAGLRWDYLPPYHEVKDRWSFLNPTATNSATGTPGALEFAGSAGGSVSSCGCRTPVSTYWKNWGPRVGITYQTDSKTVWRVGIGHVFSQGGGVGGRGGAFNGTGQLGFNVTATGATEVTTGAGAAPSFYLNNSAAFTSAGIANTSLFGPGFPYPTAPTPGAASTILNTGNYLNGGAFVHPSSAPGYADPYFAGRAPNFTFYNLGVERAITNSMTLAINYVGNQSHHLINSTNSGTGNARGYWINQLNPIYLAGLGNVSDSTGKNPILTAAATAANVAKAQAAMPGINIPTFFQNAAAVKTSATIAQGLVAFPQYSSVADTFGNVGNFSYNALQITMQQRLSHGLTFNFNYTWSRNIGDDGPFRTGFALPAASISGGTHDWKMDRIDRGLTAVNIPHAVHAYGVWNLPYVHGNFMLKELTRGWSLSGIYTYAAGTPVQVTYGGCTTPLQGQCMPDVTSGFGKNNARVNGGYGHGPAGGVTACNLGTGTGCKAVSYFANAAFQAPATVNPGLGTALNLIGNAPRTGALNLTNPGSMNLDTGLRKQINITERYNVVLEADAFNTWNHVNFGSPNAVWSANPATSTFGQLTSVANSPRFYELAGHFNF